MGSQNRKFGSVRLDKIHWSLPFLFGMFLIPNKKANGLVEVRPKLGDDGLEYG